MQLIPGSQPLDRGDRLPGTRGNRCDTRLNLGTVEVTGSGDNLKVNDANVICGGVKTANATVYLIDAVLMPSM